MALVFFAGHGVQIRGENYLLAADFTDLTLDEVASKGVPLTDIRDTFDRIKPALGIVILDACRNNPFVETGQAAQGLARSQGGTGTLIAYATDPGNVAYDGTGANSFFTEALIGHIADPGVEVRLMFGRVRQQVAMVTGGAQVPWVEESVLGEHFLDPDPNAAPKPDEIAGEIGAWQAASTGGDRADYEAYLAAYPDGLFRGFAEERLAALGEWIAEAAVGTDLASLKSGDRSKLTVALATLGFLPQTRGAGAGRRGSRRRAVEIRAPDDRGRHGGSRPNLPRRGPDDGDSRLDHGAADPNRHGGSRQHRADAVDGGTGARRAGRAGRDRRRREDHAGLGRQGYRGDRRSEGAGARSAR